MTTPVAGTRGLAHGQMAQVKGEPEFGLVLPTLLARGVFGGDMSGDVGGNVWEGMRGWVVGVWGWIFDDLPAAAGGGGGGGGEGVRATTQAGASGWESGQADGWSIMNDEVL